MADNGIVLDETYIIRLIEFDFTTLAIFRLKNLLVRSYKQPNKQKKHHVNKVTMTPCYAKIIRCFQKVLPAFVEIMQNLKYIKY